jgi:hypothetical protein
MWRLAAMCYILENQAKYQSLYQPFRQVNYGSTHSTSATTEGIPQLVACSYFCTFIILKQLTKCSLNN